MKLVYYKRRYVEYQIPCDLSIPINNQQDLNKLLQTSNAIGIIKEEKKTMTIDKDTKSLNEITEEIKKHEYNIVDIEILAVSDVYR